jgi:cysteine-rich repeat protein
MKKRYVLFLVVLILNLKMAVSAWTDDPQNPIVISDYFSEGTKYALKLDDDSVLVVWDYRDDSDPYNILNYPLMQVVESDGNLKWQNEQYGGKRLSNNDNLLKGFSVKGTYVTNYSNYFYFVGLYSDSSYDYIYVQKFDIDGNLYYDNGILINLNTGSVNTKSEFMAVGSQNGVFVSYSNTPQNYPEYTGEHRLFFIDQNGLLWQDNLGIVAGNSVVDSRVKLIYDGNNGVYVGYNEMIGSTGYFRIKDFKEAQGVSSLITSFDFEVKLSGFYLVNNYFYFGYKYGSGQRVLYKVDKGNGNEVWSVDLYIQNYEPYELDVDKDGNSFVVYYSVGNFPNQKKVNKVDNGGIFSWDNGGVDLDTNNNFYEPGVYGGNYLNYAVPDGEGGVLVGTTDIYNQDSIYLYHIKNDGSLCFDGYKVYEYNSNIFGRHPFIVLDNQLQRGKILFYKGDGNSQLAITRFPLLNYDPLPHPIPSVSNIMCDVGNGYENCNYALNGAQLLGVKATCSDGDSQQKTVTFTIKNPSDDEVDIGSGDNIGNDEYEFNPNNVVLGADGDWIIEVVCENVYCEMDSDFSSIFVYTIQQCGNGILDEGEECDDGCLNDIPYYCEQGTDDGDGCNYLCQLEQGYTGICGDGIISGGEQCEDGLDNACDNICNSQGQEYVSCVQPGTEGECSCLCKDPEGAIFSYNVCYCPGGEDCSDGIGKIERTIYRYDLETEQYYSTGETEIVDCYLKKSAPIPFLGKSFIFVVLLFLIGYYLLNKKFYKQLRRH